MFMIEFDFPLFHQNMCLRKSEIVTRALYIYYFIFGRPILFIQWAFFVKFCRYIWLVFKSGL